MTMISMMNTQIVKKF